MKHLTFIATTAVLTLNLELFSQQWPIGMGSLPSDFGHAVAWSGNKVFMAGTFQGTVDFDPGTGVANLIAVGNDGFVAKYNDGNPTYQWAIGIGGSYVDPQGITVDGSGNVYVTGSFIGTADFDGGGGAPNLSSFGTSQNAFVAKYNPAGVYQWAISLRPATDIANVAHNIVVDAGSNVYTTGYFYGTVDFDGGGGTYNLASAGGKDIFFAKYTSAGVLQWAFRLGQATDDESNDIAIDNSDNIYITGNFQNTVDFNPSGGAPLTAAGANNDIFAAKYNSAGAYQWAFRVGQQSCGEIDDGRKIAVNGSDLYITGNFTGVTGSPVCARVDFDPDVVGTANRGGTNAMYVAKYTTAMAFQWAFTVGFTGVYPYSIIADANYVYPKKFNRTTPIV